MCGTLQWVDLDDGDVRLSAFQQQLQICKLDSSDSGLIDFFFFLSG